MKHKRIDKVLIGLIIVGVLLMVISAVFLIRDFVVRGSADKINGRAVNKIEAAFEVTYEAFPEERSNNEMPAFEIDGRDYSALLEVPSYGVKLPILQQWNTGYLKTTPCRFSGSIYNGTLIIGGGAKQFDFITSVEPGDEIMITDMTGGLYSLKVSEVRHSKSAEAEKLESDFPLCLFAKVSDNYLIVHCSFE